MKIKCPICKSIQEFEKIEISPMHINTYIYGDYTFLHRCKKCHVVIATDKQKEIK